MDKENGGKSLGGAKIAARQLASIRRMATYKQGRR